MTLVQLIRIIESVASKQPAINMIVRSDVFRINSAPSMKYGTFVWTQGQHSTTVEGLITYSFTFFYVDRLLDNLNNQVEIQSVGVEVLGNIIRNLEDFNIGVADYTLQPFNQRFTDECAGVFANVKLTTTATSLCAETFEDFNLDFNEDFLIY